MTNLFANAAFAIKWNNTSVSSGDKFKISCRSWNGDSYFPGPNLVNGLTSNDYHDNGGFAIVNGNYNGPIYAGAQIKIQVVEDRYNTSANTNVQTFTSQQDYKNIEEWFVESGDYLNFNQNNNINSRNNNINFNNPNSGNNSNSSNNSTTCNSDAEEV